MTRSRVRCSSISRLTPSKKPARRGPSRSSSRGSESATSRSAPLTPRSSITRASSRSGRLHGGWRSCRRCGFEHSAQLLRLPKQVRCLAALLPVRRQVTAGVSTRRHPMLAPRTSRSTRLRPNRYQWHLVDCGVLVHAFGVACPDWFRLTASSDRTRRWRVGRESGRSDPKRQPRTRRMTNQRGNA